MLKYNKGEIYMKETNIKKRKVIALILIVALIALSIGITYSLYNYNFIGNKNTLESADISLEFLESNTNIITIENALPMSDNNGISQTETFDFSVTSKTNRDMTIKYILSIQKLSVDTAYTSLNDNQIKVYLEDYSGNQKVAPTLISSLSNYKLYTGTHTHNSSTETVQDKFKLRVWIDGDVDTSSWTSATKLQYKFKIGLTSEEAHPYINTLKKLANKNQTIDFSQAPSDTNGNGVNILEGTENDPNPIYFYRGFDTEGKDVVSKNNVLFGGFCWKIVRTTDTGGIKIVYNGEPTQDNKCTNTTGTVTQISTSQFNSSNNSPAYNGYMYGTVYPYNSGAGTEGSLFGSNFTYSNGTYTLTNTSTTKDSTHHYSCNNAEGTCSTIRYYYYNNYYIKLTNGKSVSDALSEMQTNTTDSTIKTAIDNWYETNLASYEEYLEDTVWCNDRSMQTTTNGWRENGSLTEYMYYGANGRVGYSHNSITPTFKPSVTCPNKNDAFTVDDTTKGNGALNHPVALLTADELTMAGSGIPGYSTSSYLYTNGVWWSLSPNSFFNTDAYGFVLRTKGSLNYLFVRYSYGVRPAVSLAPGTSFASGDGSSDTPYKVE